MTTGTSISTVMNVTSIENGERIEMITDPSGVREGRHAVKEKARERRNAKADTDD